MKRFSLPCLSFVAALVGFAPALRAQDMAPAAPPPPAADQADAGTPPPPPRRQNGAQMMKVLKEKLSLTDDQVQQVADILKAQRQAGMALRQDTTLSDDDKRAKGMALMKDTRAKIRAILTADQQTIFDAMPAMPGPGRRRPPN
jgi:Spy/CpxP family protein refolding chaperone